MKKYLTNSSTDTKNLGSKFSKTLKRGDIVLLYGALGAGKTTFVQGLALGLGIKDRILSPTFVLVRQYKIPHPTPFLKGEGWDRKSSRPFGSAQGRQARTITLYHIDLYRIEKQTDIISLGLDEIINEGGITVIEWADRLSNFKQVKTLPAGRQGYRIYFKHLNGDRREIAIEKI